MPPLSWQARLLSPLLRLALKPVVFPRRATAVSMQLTASAFARLEKVRPTPRKARITPVSTIGFRGEWVSTGEATDRVVLYFHGGGYMVMSPRGYREFAFALARELNARVLVVDYRQGADYPWPAPLADAVAAYRWLLDSGTDPANIVIGGDSAGGHLTLSTLLALRDHLLPMPRGALLLSPWANFACDFPSMDANRHSDVMLDTTAVRSNAIYQIQGQRLHDPANSPAFADYTGLPPLHIVVSDSEILWDDSRAVRDAARRAGVAVDYREWQGLPHVFPTFISLLPEAKAAVADMASFVEWLFSESAPGPR